MAHQLTSGGSIPLRIAEEAAAPDLGARFALSALDAWSERRKLMQHRLPDVSDEDVQTLRGIFDAAIEGANDPYNYEVEELEILKGAEKIEGEDPGSQFRYSSAVTQVFVKIAERVDNLSEYALRESTVRCR